MFNRLKAAAAVVFRPMNGGLTIVSNWLANALWLIKTEFLPLAQNGYGKNAVVYSCLRLLSQSVPEAPLKVYQVNGDEKTEVDPSHPLAQLIKYPNELMTEYEMHELKTLHMGITGRSTWWKERDRVGRIIGLIPLRPDRVGPIYSADTSKAGQKVLLGWSYQVPGTGQFVPLPRADVMMTNFPNPFEESGGMVEGLGPLQVLAAEVSADNEATSFVGALLKNFAQPTTVIKTKAPIRDQKQADLIKNKFRSEFGAARRGMPALLDAETEIDSLGFNLQELEFPDLRDVAESRIAAAFGVPPGLAHLNVGLKRNTMANVEQDRQYFAETTLANYWKRYADVWNRDIVPEFGDNLIVEFDTSQVKALAGQRQKELQPLKEAVDTGKASVNEYRQKLKLDPLPPEVGDVLYIPSGVTVVPATEDARKILDERKAEAVQQAQEAMAEQQKLLPPGQGNGQQTDNQPPPNNLNAAKLTAHVGHTGPNGPHRGHGGSGLSTEANSAIEGIRNAKIEHGVGVGANGELLFKLGADTGTAGSLRVPNAERAQLKGATFIHNHPAGMVGDSSGGSFSGPDMLFAAGNKVRSMVIVTENHTYTASVTDSKDWKRAAASYQTTAVKSLKQARADVTSGKRTIEDVQSNLSHEIMTQVAKKTGISYSKAAAE